MADPAYQKLRDTNALPSPTGVALELLRLTGNDNVLIDDIIATVESDPALDGRVLKLVNSAFAAVSHRVGAVSVAVKLLGTRTIKNLALGLSLLSNNRNGPCEAFDYERFWSESLARAVAARRLADQLGNFPPDEAFTIGLLGKVGRLALATVQPLEYARVLRLICADDWRETLDLERQTFGIDHNALSAEMMADWRLPDLFCEATRLQDAPEQSASQPAASAHQLARTLHLSGSVARMLVQPHNDLESGTALAEEAGKSGICGAILPQLFDSIRDKWRELGAIFSVSTHDVLPFEEIRRTPQPAGAATGDRELHALAPPDAHRPDAEALSVLIVDDDPAALRLLERYLEEGGYRVMKAASAVEALDTDRVGAPQLIVTDWAMPEMSGLELCRRFRAYEGLGFVYIIVLTAHSEKNRVVEALDAGADDFLSKPYSREELLAHVRAGERIVRLEAKLAERSRELSYFNARLAAANDKLRILATTDELTGLGNRREALARLAEHWALAARHADSLACIAIDIDLFKNLNDTYGHAAGDSVLRATANVLRQTSRAGEVVYRFGGEEFLVICPRATAAATEKAAERMRLAVAATVTQFNGAQLSVTISAGVAERPASMPDAEDLLKAADNALYVAKQSGRNRTCVAGGPVPPTTTPAGSTVPALARAPYPSTT